MKNLTKPTRINALLLLAGIIAGANLAQAEEKTAANSSINDRKLTRCLEALNKAKEVVVKAGKSSELSKEVKSSDASDIKKDSSNGHDSKRSE